MGLTILIVALWGGNAVAVSFSVDVLPPVAVAGLRFTMATAFMLVYCFYEGTSLRVDAARNCLVICGGLLVIHTDLELQRRCRDDQLIARRNAH